MIDELGYLAMPAEAAATFFQVITRRYEHGSVLLTTNRHIADWGQIFDDTTVAIAILDRLLHHTSVISINGDSYRMRAHRDAINAINALPSQVGKNGDHNWGILVILDRETSPAPWIAWFSACPGRITSTDGVVTRVDIGVVLGWIRDKAADVGVWLGPAVVSGCVLTSEAGRG